MDFSVVNAAPRSYGVDVQARVVSDVPRPARRANRLSGPALLFVIVSFSGSCRSSSDTGVASPAWACNAL
ncbi:hypothetical protein [Burkholderia sp. BCC1977]|uniref:hypothetical protein n=1 Tax=Burkholderia sp. BCC1977 TaxID=2817440 RepID=UPI002ABD5158|nr:hypothetical protein [Burkholderia sp. BCC1977]